MVVQVIDAVVAIFPVIGLQVQAMIALLLGQVFVLVLVWVELP